MLLALCAISCTKSENEFSTPEAITLLSSEEIFMEKGGSNSFEFKIEPADARFNYNVSGDCDIRLECASTGLESAYIKLADIELISQEQGHYRATVEDLGGDADYKEEMVLKIVMKNAAGEWIRISSRIITFTNVVSLLTEITFLQELNPTAINKDFSIDVSSGVAVLKSALISSPRLIASFDTNGIELYVNGVKQVSGVTINDFSKPVTYTAKLGREYSFSVQVCHSGLPMVFIETAGGASIPSKQEDWLSGSKLKIYNPDWTLAYEGGMGIRGRGNTTWGYPKKPYAIKLDSKSEILGMPKHKRWVLLANWMDRTLLRNCVSFNLASRSGLAYTPRGQFVEVFINGTHNGNYFLCEQIKVDKNRVNVEEYEESIIDGGYLFELDTYYDEEFKFKSSGYDLPYMFKDPDEVTSAHVKFIQDYVNNLEASLLDDARFAAGEYRDYIDVESFVDWWLVMELTGIGEPNHPKSSYMYKKAGGKLAMGPVWDFDWETYMPKYGNEFRIAEAIYYERLLQDPYFKSVVKERWNAQKSSFSTIPGFIRQQAAAIHSSESMNYEMWPIDFDVNKDINLSFDEAVERMIEGYNKKFEWLNQQISKM